METNDPEFVARLKVLKSRTELPFLKCKEALIKANGDVDAAIKILMDATRNTSFDFFYSRGINVQC